jgi:hypothetical protein
MMNNLLKQILNQIERAYVSFSNPSFAFVDQVFEARPYQDLIRILETEFELEEITDLNDDVSFVYILSQYKFKWSVRLSFIGKYFYLQRQDVEPFDVEYDDVKKLEARLQSIFSANGFLAIPKQILSTRIKLQLYDESKPTVFRCLFSDHYDI